MGNIDTGLLLIIICSIVILSYVFLIISRVIRVPSVILLLMAGIAFREISNRNNLLITFPTTLIEALGVVGLIMIVLEAGLDLKLTKDKFRLIRNSFFSGLFILIISMALISAILYYWLHEPWINCMVYAIPLSIMSSSIVIPSIHHLTQQKKEFLVYEASFSDILGILLFNYFTAGEVLTGRSLAIFGGKLIIAVVLSLILSFLLFIIMSKTKLNIKFFLIFSLLILIYSSGKIFHLPSLIIILVFGLMINNWDLIRWPRLLKFLPHDQVNPVLHLLHSITAESSFLIRTFFFILFGYSMQLDFLSDINIWEVGGLIVLALFFVRFLYLKFFLHTNVFPESFFIPRGLVTIVLYYKIPDRFKLSGFDDDILFFIIFITSIVMTIGMIFYKQKPAEMTGEMQFNERPDIL